MLGTAEGESPAVRQKRKLVYLLIDLYTAFDNGEVTAGLVADLAEAFTTQAIVGVLQMGVLDNPHHLRVEGGNSRDMLLGHVPFSSSTLSRWACGPWVLLPFFLGLVLDTPWSLLV